MIFYAKLWRKETTTLPINRIGKPFFYHDLSIITLFLDPAALPAPVPWRPKFKVVLYACSQDTDVGVICFLEELHTCVVLFSHCSQCIHEFSFKFVYDIDPNLCIA